MTWLNARDAEQEDELDRLLAGCHPGTGEWITGNAKLRSWMQRRRNEQVLWLNGKPGSGKLRNLYCLPLRLMSANSSFYLGKSIICAQLIRFLRHFAPRQTISTSGLLLQLSLHNSSLLYIRVKFLGSASLTAETQPGMLRRG